MFKKNVELFEPFHVFYTEIANDFHGQFGVVPAVEVLMYLLESDFHKVFCVVLGSGFFGENTFDVITKYDFLK